MSNKTLVQDKVSDMSYPVRSKVLLIKEDYLHFKNTHNSSQFLALVLPIKASAIKKRH